jgi:hypothetical protein
MVEITIYVGRQSNMKPESCDQPIYTTQTEHLNILVPA